MAAWGRLGTGWLGYVIVGLLGHNLDLVVRQLYLLMHVVMLGLRPLIVIFAIFFVI